MFENLSNKFANLLVNNDVIEKDDYEIYRYGFEALIYFIVNISVALLIGIVFNRVIHTIIFLCCYCTLRQFTGGYHARNYTACTLSFVVMYLFIIFISNNVVVEEYKYIFLLLYIFSVIVIYIMAPLEHRDKPLTSEEKVKYKKISLNIIMGISLIMLIFASLNPLKEYAIYPFFAITAIALLLIIGKYRKKI